MQVNKKLDLETQKPSDDECSKETEEESPKNPGKKDNKEKDKEKLAEKMEQNHLCPNKWLSIFGELGIDTVGKLQFVDLDGIKILKDKATFQLEKNILSTFLGEEPKRQSLINYNGNTMAQYRIKKQNRKK